MPTHAAVLSVDDLKTIAVAEAADHGLNSEHFLKVVECESHWNPQAIGDYGKSHGLVQIYAPAHLDVSIAEANNPYFALHFMAEEWSKDNASIWTCYRQLKKAGWH